MKFKLFAAVLALSLVAWAQENPSGSNPNSTPKMEAKSCCHHAEGAKDGMACCGQDSPCCGKDNKDQAKCEKDGNSCCGEKSAMNCCGEKCEKKAS